MRLLMDEYKATILVVDDSPVDIDLLTGILKGDCKIKIADNGLKALEISRIAPPDLILLGTEMDGMDGYEICRVLKHNERFSDIPVIFLTDEQDVNFETKCFEAGGVDYVNKPINRALLLARVKTHINFKKIKDVLHSSTQYFENKLASSIENISTMQDVFSLAMVSLVKNRDNETGGHIMRTQLYVQELAFELANYKKFNHILTEENVKMIAKSAQLHDIGKIGIPDHILLKPTVLTQQEFDVIKTHTVLGRDAILTAEKIAKYPNPFLKFAKEIVYSHHECWDGSGYPEGLKANAIPLSARLMSVADVYDALISRRVYKNMVPHDVAVNIIKNDSGKHFDPDIVDAFLRVERKFYQISELYASE
ncbi:MAG: response regulator [Clostridia bacterium]|nr:response regulator [Clostridia bacterium]